MKKLFSHISSFFSKVKNCIKSKENLKSAIANFKSFSYEVINNNKRTMILITVISLFINLLQEWMLRKDLFDALKIIITSPVMFLFNCLIILATYSLIFLFRRRTFVFFLLNILWISVAFVQKCLMDYRTTPFNASDFRVLKSALSIIPVYFSKFQIFLLIAVIVLVVLFSVYLFIKCKKSTAKRLSSSLITLTICVATFTATFINANFNLDTTHFSNLPKAFRKHGFTYCFLCSIFDYGIQKPDNYSIEAVKNVVDKTQTEVDKQDIPKVNPDDKVSLPDMEVNSVTLEDGEYPNIIFLQLESFYDVNYIDGYTYSENPVPYFTALKEKYPNALFRVPSIGAGTANTEFEVITGMEVAYFGIAEYPYLSVLQNNTCESMAYNTKSLGYTSHAIHNHRGTFYDRHKVFPNLGFDTFTSLENMPEIVKNKKNWAKDSMLTDEIVRALEYSPDGPDLIYAISVQPHGRYPGSWRSYNKTLEGQEPHIKLYGNDDNPENPGINYYINEIHEVDQFLEDLINTLTDIAQPTVLVMYGDHLPAFSVEEWSLLKGDCYQTEYVIWNNCNLDFSDAPDLSAFQLSSYIFKKLGIIDGNMNKLNQTYIGTDVDYSPERELLEYDMLYGNKFALEQLPVYQPTQNIKYGLAKVSVDEVIAYDGKCYVLGQNFNQYSHVRINDQVIETSANEDETILIIDKIPNDSDIITVVQRAGNHSILGESINYAIFNQSMITDIKPEFLNLSDQQINPQESSELDNLSGMETPADVATEPDSINNKDIESLG